MRGHAPTDLSCLRFARSRERFAQAPRQPDWAALEDETLRHFQAMLRLDTTDPPGGEKPVVEYLKQVLEAEGIPVKTFALEAHRPNLVARLKGNGKKRPLLIMAHTDTVNVDPKKWSFPLRPGLTTRPSAYSPQQPRLSEAGARRGNMQAAE